MIHIPESQKGVINSRKQSCFFRKRTIKLKKSTARVRSQDEKDKVIYEPLMKRSPSLH